jgi:hypothetical protein
MTSGRSGEGAGRGGRRGSGTPPKRASCRSKGGDRPSILAMEKGHNPNIKVFEASRDAKGKISFTPI